MPSTHRRSPTCSVNPAFSRPGDQRSCNDMEVEVRKPKSEFQHAIWQFRNPRLVINFSDFLCTEVKPAPLEFCWKQIRQCMRKCTKLHNSVQPKLCFITALQKCLFIMLMILLVIGKSIRSSVQDRPLWTFQMEKHLILDSSGLFWSQRCFIVVLGDKINHWGNDYNCFNWITLTKGKQYLMLFIPESQDIYHNYWMVYTRWMANIY